MRRVKFINLILVIGLMTVPGYARDVNKSRVALVMKALSNPFFSKMEAGARQYAKEHNLSLEVFGVERETDVESQIGIVENLITRGYGAIVISPADSQKLIPVCEKAIRKGLVVINIDDRFHKETLDKLGLSIPFVGSDNRQGAEMVGEYIKHKLAGKGRVLIIEGIRGVENAELRKAGLIKTVTTGSEIKVVASESANWHSDEAFALVTRLLEKHGPVDAIICANDNMALGALQAVDMQDLTGNVLLAGYDNIDAVRNEMRNKRIHVTIEQHPELMGRYGVELAEQALEGKRPPQVLGTDLDLITYETFGKKVAISLSTSEGFFCILVESVKKYANLFGFQVILADAQHNSAQQLVDLQNFVKQKVDVIIVSPVNSEAVLPGVELSNEAGIPVITVDRKCYGGKIVCHIGSDNIAGGRLAGEFLAQKLKNKGKIFEMEGIPGTSTVHDRGTGFSEVIKGYPEIAIIGREAVYFDRAKAKAAMTQILKKKIPFDAVFAHNDKMILGVRDALSEANAPKRLLVGFDGSPEAIQAIRQDHLDATIVQRPDIMGKLAIQNVARMFRGEKISPVVSVGVELIKK